VSAFSGSQTWENIIISYCGKSLVHSDVIDMRFGGYFVEHDHYVAHGH